jgi:hypothetical protein
VPGVRSGRAGIRDGDKGSSEASERSTAGHPPAPCRLPQAGFIVQASKGTG